MQVGYLVEYRRPPHSTDKRTRNTSIAWLAIGIVRAPIELTPANTLDRVRGEYPQLDGYEVRVRHFHPLPGCRVMGDTANVLVIESAVLPVVA